MVTIRFLLNIPAILIMESPVSWHMAAGLAHMYSEHPLPSVCVNKENKLINDISVLFLYGFPEPCLVPVTVPSNSWRYSDRTRLCGVRRGGTVTSFYFFEGVKKRGSLCLFYSLKHWFLRFKMRKAWTLKNTARLQIKVKLLRIYTFWWRQSYYQDLW